MKILVVTQYFYPEEFKINDLVKGLVDRGYEVVVLTCKPNYPKGKFYKGYKFWGVNEETLYGAKVIRVPVIPRGNGNSLRLVLNYFSFVFFSCLYVLCHRLRTDRIFCWDTSPILQAYAGMLVNKQTKAPLSMWVQDLWPESVSATGKIRQKGVMSILTTMVRGIYKRFDVLFIQSRNFRKSIEEKGHFKAEYVYAPNWAEDLYTEPNNIDLDKYRNLIPSGFVVMFAGNIGAAQDFGSIIKAAELTRDEKDIKWVIVGEGRKRAEAQALVEHKKLGDTVTFLGRYPSYDMPSFFVHADVMLVALRDEYIFSLTIPAKTQTYMAFGKPIVSMLNGESNKVIEEAGCGFTASAGDFKALAANVIRAKNMPEEVLSSTGNNGRKYYDANFSKKRVIDLIAKKIENQQKL